MTTPARSTTTRSGRTYSHPLTREWQPPSVTTIIDVLSKPQLKWWAARQAAVAAVADVDHLADRIARDGEDNAIRFLAAAHARTSKLSSELGSHVHDVVNRTALKQRIGQADILFAEGRVEAWNMFVKNWKPKILATEASVWSREHDYAGTLDLILDIPVVGKVIVDMKTGREPYPETALQLAAYRNAETITTKIVGSREQPMIETTGAMILMLGDRNYRLYGVDTGEQVFDVFLTARRLYTWQNKTSKTVLDGPLSPPPPKKRVRKKPV